MDKERKVKFIIYAMLDKISEMGIKGDEKVAREILKQRTNYLGKA